MNGFDQTRLMRLMILHVYFDSANDFFMGAWFLLEPRAVLVDFGVIFEKNHENHVDILPPAFPIFCFLLLRSRGYRKTNEDTPARKY